MSIGVYFETFGCQMNVSDTEKAKQSVAAAGLSLADGPETADVVMLNTCSVRAKAERKVLARAQELHHLRRNGRESRLLVGIMGCVAQLEGENLFEDSSKVGLVLGTQAIERLPQLITEAYTRGKRVLDLGKRDEYRRQLTDSVTSSAVGPAHFDDLSAYAVEQERRDRVGYDHVGHDHVGYDHDVGHDRVGYDQGDHEVTPQVGLAYRHSQHVAFVPIIEGCNKFCSYCIVPYSRGRETSRPALDILNEIRYLKSVGVAEVHLIGQNVNSYRPSAQATTGVANFRGATPFAKLLRAVAATGIPRIKFTTSFPRDFHADIVSAMEENHNLCNWVHLPVQSGSDAVLKAMRRGYTRDEYVAKIAVIKNSSRNIALTTDFIVGYPTETEEDFALTLTLYEQCAFDNAYLFKYSPRPGTPSSQLADSVPAQVKTDRFYRLQALQREKTQASLRSQLGHVLQVLTEKQSARNPAHLSGHSTCQRVVHLHGQPSQIGRVVPVKITDVRANGLYGEALAL